MIALNILMAGPSLISRMAVRSFCKIGIETPDEAAIGDVDVNLIVEDLG